MRNVIFTPHLGASSLQAQENVSLAIASQILDYLQRGLILNAVNFPSISLKDYDRLKPYMLLAETARQPPGAALQARAGTARDLRGGDLLDIPTQPLTQSVTKGLLDPIMAEKVNLINAPVLLKQRQIELIASTTSQSRGYTGEITVRRWGPEKWSLQPRELFSGTGSPPGSLNDYMLEAGLEGINLMSKTTINRGLSAI